MKNYRDNGAVGALLDEYEKAILELTQLIQGITPKELSLIVDPETKDEDCRSVQSILSHTVQAGYSYAISIRNWMGEDIQRGAKLKYSSADEYCAALRAMFNFTEQVFQDFKNIQLEVNSPDKKILTNWGQRYDVEQLLEHAICHILRHRRQIERFQIKFPETRKA